MPQRVVVTGLGIVSPVGLTTDETWAGLLAGKSGFHPVRSFDTSAYRVHVGAEVEGFSPRPWFHRLEAPAVGRGSQLAVAAARQAVVDCGIEAAALVSAGAGVVMGTTTGEPLEVEHLDDLLVAGTPEEVNGRFARAYPCHVLATHVAAELGLRGPLAMIPTACAAGNYAVAHAYDLVQSGRASVMLAGGADCFSRITFTGFARLGAVAPDVCRPFDRHRKGMIPGEGAAVLVLEGLAAARRRGARIYAEVAGYGLSCDAFHMTAAQSEGEGAVRAMERALAASGLQAQEVSYVNAHGTGTPTNDRIEALAITRVFGEENPPPVSSIKSMIGHTMGAASAIEAAICCLAVHGGQVPPTMNHDEPDAGCGLDFVPNRCRTMNVAVAMSNAYAFGGNNASVIFRREAK